MSALEKASRRTVKLKAAGRHSRIDPLAEAHERYADGTQSFEGEDKMADVASEAIEPPHDERTLNS
jgi:hypothetical protein